MIATGVIVEYNPFHNGHHYQVKTARKETQADVLVAVMSGHFLQRGEPALLNKWQRAKMALQNGVDLVIELPYAFATGHATDFAYGGVTLLEALNCQSISFGSESGQIELFKSTYDAFEQHHEQTQQIIQEAVKKGLSYPQALQTAHKQIQSQTEHKLLDLAQPNNILGYHYYEQIQKHQYRLQSTTVKRKGAGYHDDVDDRKTIASATGIRKALFETKQLEILEKFMPATAYDVLKGAQNYASWAQFYPFFRFTVLRMTPETLRQYVDVSEGIEFLFLEAAKEYATFEGFMKHVKSKRYTWTRLQRMMTHILVGYTKEQRAIFQTPSYIRVLGMTEKGQQYLSQEKKRLTLPLISRIPKKHDDMLALDLRATDLYMIGTGVNTTRLDFQTPPIRL